MAKIIELGVVKTIHASGIVETDKGKRTYVSAKVGDRIIQDAKSGVISIAAKKASETAAQKKARVAKEVADAEAEAKEVADVDNTPPDFNKDETDEEVK